MSEKSNHHHRLSRRHKGTEMKEKGIGIRLRTKFRARVEDLVHQLHGEAFAPRCQG